MSLKNIKIALAVVVLTTMVTGVFAEEAAPVYDVDNYPPQFDGAPDSSITTSSPPSPSTPSAPTSPSSSPETQPNDASDTDLQPQLQTRTRSEPIISESSPPPSTTGLTLEQRTRRLGQQMNNAQQSTVSSRVDALQNQVQSLTGQVEELTHQLQQLQNQQRALSIDVDKRLHQPSSVSTTDSNKIEPTGVAAKPSGNTAKLETTSSSAPLLKSTTQTDLASAKAPTDTQPNVAEEQQIYQTAYDLIKAKKYNDAVATLQKMLQKYPTGQFAANAHYWLGELYGLLNKNDLSAQEFSVVVKAFPSSPKVADAQLKIGLIYAGQFKWRDAKASFKKVINDYPGTSSAHLASEQLKQMKLAGH